MGNYRREKLKKGNGLGKSRMASQKKDFESRLMRRGGEGGDFLNHLFLPQEREKHLREKNSAYWMEPKGGRKQREHGPVFSPQQKMTPQKGRDEQNL